MIEKRGARKFLEYTAKALEVPIKDLGCLAHRSNHPSSITSMCTVLAESEVISIRARGVAKEDIAAGLIASIALRVAVIAKRMGLKEHIAFVGRSGEKCRDEDCIGEGTWG